MTENELVNTYAKMLSPHFRLWREVDGVSMISGARKRIDVVMESREIPDGCIEPMRFGVEFKSDQLQSMNQYTGWLRQAIGYTQCHWGSRNIRLPILICPFMYYGGEEHGQVSSVIRRVAGQFGIGEMGIVTFDRDYGYGKQHVKICVSGSTMWTSYGGWNKSLVKMDFSKRYVL